MLRTGINIEGNFDLRNTLGGRWNADEVEVTKELVVSDKLTFTLVDFDLDGRLAVGSGREDLRLFGRDRGVTVDQLGHDTAEGLDA